MPLILWNENLSVNIALVDRQHQKLISLINDLHNANREGRGNQKLKLVVSELEFYAKSHFTQEERYFARYSYPAAESHIRAHQIFIEKVRQFKSAIEQGGIGLPTEILSFLRFWIVEHIMRVDKKYSSYLNEKGLR